MFTNVYNPRFLGCHLFFPMPVFVPVFCTASRGAKLPVVVFWYECFIAFLALFCRQQAILPSNLGTIPCIVPVVNQFTIVTLVLQKISRFCQFRRILFLPFLPACIRTRLVSVRARLEDILAHGTFFIR